MTVMSEALTGYLTRRAAPDGNVVELTIAATVKDDADETLLDEMMNGDSEVRLSLDSLSKPVATPAPAPKISVADVKNPDYDPMDHLDDLVPRLAAGIDEFHELVDWMVKHRAHLEEFEGAGGDTLNTLNKIRIKLLAVQPALYSVGP